MNFLKKLFGMGKDAENAETPKTDDTSTETPATDDTTEATEDETTQQ